jgi:hypothetical protein
MRIVLIHIIFAVVSLSLFAQEKKQPLILPGDSVNLKAAYPLKFNNVIKSNPVAVLMGQIPFTGEYRAMYEYTKSPSQSSMIGVSYLGKGILIRMIEMDTNFTNRNIKLVVRGVRLQAAHRFYLTGIGKFFSKDYEYAPLGFYISPHISYASAIISSKFLSTYDIFIRATYFNVSLLSGLQMELFDGFVIDAFTGLGYKKNTLYEHYSPGQSRPSKDADDIPFFNSNIKFSLGFNVGYAF